MASLLLSLFLKVCSLLMALVLLVSPGAPLSGEQIAPTDQDALQLNFSVLADTHIETFEMFRFQYLRGALRDIRGAAVKSDALVLLGDNTMNGQITEYIMLYSILSAWNSSKNTLVAMGNHDINQSQNTIDWAVAKHNAFFNAYTRGQNEKPYYYRVINDCYFIVLGSEDGDAGTAAYISPAQIAWLEDTMALAGASGKPVFVFNHQPFNDKVHFPDDDPNRDDGHYWWSFDGMGGASDAVFDALKAHDNVFFFYGHIHAPLELLNVCETEGVTLVNVPPFTAHVGGSGFYVEVYGDKVVLRARRYAEGVWDTDHVYTVELV